ncbi:MAG: RuBisCO large subunit C-terminal-like domain-containing protein [Candidatus Helarchaeota archaeon]|nr:RuBisCO large subunit C-terminal-like domain-containing protein [Candidatus Helarchaeota archaeon]
MGNEDRASLFFAKETDIDLEQNIIGTYAIKSTRFSTKESAEQIAMEESIGTWTDITTETEYVRKLAAKAFAYSEKKEGIVKVAYPLELFDPEIGGIPNLLSIVAGNLFGLTGLDRVKLLDIDLPKQYVQSYPGPQFGIEGIRHLVGTSTNRRPHVGTIIKPKVGLTPADTAKVAYEAASGGLDLIKDDETLTSQKFCPFEERLLRVLEKLDLVKQETGKTVLYAVNISATNDKLFKLADFAKDNGANCLMIDILTTGFGVVHQLVQNAIKLPLHIHRTMHGALTEGLHGVSMMVLAKLTRLVGGDQLHTGTAAGKMGLAEGIPEIQLINNFLRADWYGLKPIFPVASGGVHPALVPINVNKLGTDLVIQAGGGVHGHPQGTRAGARAMVQAAEASFQKITLEIYAKTHPELASALTKWKDKYAKKD